MMMMNAGELASGGTPFPGDSGKQQGTKAVVGQLVGGCPKFGGGGRRRGARGGLSLIGWKNGGSFYVGIVFKSR